MRFATTTSDSFKQSYKKEQSMPQVHWILSNGDRVSDDVNEGTSLMDAVCRALLVMSMLTRRGCLLAQA